MDNRNDVRTFACGRKVYCAVLKELRWTYSAQFPLSGDARDTIEERTMELGKVVSVMYMACRDEDGQSYSRPLVVMSCAHGDPIVPSVFMLDEAAENIGESIGHVFEVLLMDEEGAKLEHADIEVSVSYGGPSLRLDVKSPAGVLLGQVLLSDGFVSTGVIAASDTFTEEIAKLRQEFAAASSKSSEVTT